MAKDPKPKRPFNRKGEEFADLYQDDVEFEDEDFVEEDGEVDLDDEDLIDEDDWDEEDEDGRGRKTRRRGAGKKPETDGQPKASAVGKFRERLRPRPVRPGEQDVLQSPVVLGLFGGTLLLLLVGGILWFIIGRQSSQKAFNTAQAALDEGRYAQAILLFQDFENVYPTHKLLPKARIGEGKAKILKHISGAAPDWPKGLEELQNFIRDFKDEEEYENVKDDLRKYAREIAVGSAKTAAGLRERSLLEIPPKALLLYQRLSPQGPETEEFAGQVNRLLVAARDAVVKQETYDAAVARIEKALVAVPPQPLVALHVREELLARYPDVKTNRKVAALLQKTLNTEKSLVTAEQPELAASTEDHASPVPAPVSFITHTRTRSDQESEFRTIFGIVKGCCYGVDSATGAPIWRRCIGLDSPFFPIPIATATPGVLVFDTNRRELVALEERSGKLLWRLALNDSAAGAPLVEGGQIYLASTTNRLYKIDLETGRVTGVLHFSQPLLSPPIAAPKGQHLIAVGDRELIYTVALQEFACVQVSHVGHKRGTVSAPATSTIDAPLIEMGSLILLAENDRSDSSLLRVFSMAQPERQIVEVASYRLAGQVRDKPVLRGNQLYVPSSGERFSVFTVSDNSDQPPITYLNTNQLQTPYEGPMNLFALEGQLWLATSALRRMENNSGVLDLVGEPLAVGVTAQPLQQLGDNLFIARHRPYSSSSLLTQIHLETLKSNWGLTMGSRLLAWSGGENLVCVNEDGHVYRLPKSAFADADKAPPFQQTPSVTLNLPPELDSPLGAMPLEDGSLFAYAGGKEPRVWFVTPAGQLQRGFDIPAALQTKPVAMHGGMVLPMEGRLRYIPVKPGGPRVDDYTRKVTVNPPKNQRPTEWMHLERLDEDQLIAVDSAGSLLRIQFRTDPVSHLFEARKLALKSPVNVPFAVFEGVVILADADRQLHVLDGQTFQPLGSTALGGDATGALWMVDGRLYVETNRSELTAYEISPEPKKLWSLSLGGSGLAGSPLSLGPILLVAKQNGEVLTVDAGTGNIQNQSSIGQTLAGTPLVFGDYILAPSIDGSLYRIETLLPGGVE